VKKVAGYDGCGAPNPGGGDDTPAANNNMGEVTPTGVAQPFIPKEGFNKTSEEEIKTRPKGCGCTVPGTTTPSALFWLAPLAGIGIALGRRSRSRSRSHRA
jgi:MYXO-CTERM domain-containing protein